MEEWPTSVIRGRCSTNSCKTDKLTTFLGLMSPFLRFIVGTIDRTIKRMITLKQRISK